MSACNGKNGSVIFLTRLCVSATITEADFFLCIYSTYFAYSTIKYMFDRIRIINQNYTGGLYR